MKSNAINILVGILMIILGGLALAQKFGQVNVELTAYQGLSVFFAITSAAFFMRYFFKGVSSWGWLFPAFISAALALIISQSPGNPGEAIVAVPILLSIAIPLYIGYIQNRARWGLLIPACILSFVSVIVVLSEIGSADLIGSLILYTIASPFIIVYLANRQHKWALIIGSVLAFIGLLPLLGSILPASIVGPGFMFLFSVPFLLLFFTSKNSWWAFIPAGIFLSIGVVVLLDTLFPNHADFMIGDTRYGAYSGIMLLGFAATFGVLWILRSSRPTAWAIYPAIGLFITSILAFLWWESVNDLLPAIILLVLGTGLILNAVLKRRSTRQPAS